MALQRILDKEFRDQYGGTSRYIDQWQTIFDDPTIDRKLNKMIDRIKDIIQDHPIEQIFIHDKVCKVCEGSLSKFNKLSIALSSRLSNYKGMTLELGESVNVDGRSVTGLDLYKFKFSSQAKGVPFVIQNGTISKSNNRFFFEPKKDYFVAYIGDLAPFRYLATTFNIENERLKGR